MPLGRYTAQQLAALRHGNGAPVCLLYGAHRALRPDLGLALGAAPDQQGVPAAPGAVGQGPTVTFSVLRADGSFVGFQCATLLVDSWDTSQSNLEDADSMHAIK